MKASLAQVEVLACIAGLSFAIGPMHAQSARTNKGRDGTTIRTDSVYLRHGTRIPGYDAETVVYREHIEVLLPPTYILVPRPKPPVKGFYGWKFSFGKNPLVTLAFRPDSALSATSDNDVLRVSSLYLCRDVEQGILSCTVPVRAKGRRGNGGIVVDITEPALVQQVREAKPSVLLRQLFEPGGRFRVDETGIRYPAGR